MKQGCYYILEENTKNIKASLDYVCMYTRTNWIREVEKTKASEVVLKEIEFCLKQLEKIKEYYE